MRCLQIILQVPVREKQRNTDLRARANIETVETMVRKRRMRLLGHIYSKNECRTHTQETVRMQVGIRQAGSHRADLRYGHQMLSPKT